GLGDKSLGGEKLYDERAEEGGEEHQRKGDAENIPEAFEERANGGDEGLRPGLRNRDFDGTREAGTRVCLTRRYDRSKDEDQEENRGELEQGNLCGKKSEGHREDNDVESG